MSFKLSMMNLTPETPLEQKAAYLRTLPAIRERCSKVFTLAKEGKLEYFDYHPEKESEVAEFCAGIITRDFGPNFHTIPPHGRWRHFEPGGSRIDPLLSKWDSESVGAIEQGKRLVDLFIVSVLLDAGAGKDWAFYEKETNQKYGRSEGLAIASVHMFNTGYFSSDPEQPHRVDALALAKINPNSLAFGMQVSESNPLVGLDGRASLLRNLGSALLSSPDLFGKEGRPGNLLDFLEKESKAEGSTRTVHISALWHVLVDGLNSIWPASRTKLGGVSLGDVWPCTVLKSSAKSEGDDLVPFHKLTQWMTYSVVEAIQHATKWRFAGMEDMTGLPEYRNGGLLLDLGVLSLKPHTLPVDSASGLPRASASDPAVVEWRALTVILLDRMADAIRQKLNLTPEQLSLVQVLESATWKGGREIAKQKRPETGGPPIELESDGTIF
ncbi:duf1688 domain-containing protein [Moniliophthora roreri MCA 2997]|uniref:Duf1688 domain-containing protein n=1 Tax=Moniliophthora roreri (strain MCA 2997) TaxID=1381753 RepID=V2YM28_MONRO|nr:duf1688 domain-containing protein [Moniliophthora roreri MCA 2997]